MRLGESIWGVAYVPAVSLLRHGLLGLLGDVEQGCSIYIMKACLGSGTCGVNQYASDDRAG